MVLLNAFHLNMFDPSTCFPIFREISVEDVKTYQLESAIGHADTARILSGIFLGKEIPTNRVTISLNPGDCINRAQYIGPRLPEGATLPPGAEDKVLFVKMVDVSYTKVILDRVVDVRLLAKEV